MPRRLAITVAILLPLVLLTVPGADAPVAPAPARGTPFRWDRDAYWQALERRYAAARETGCTITAEATRRGLGRVSGILDTLAARSVGPADPLLDALEEAYFTVSAMVAACPTQLDSHVAAYGRMRETVKRQSEKWDVTSAPARNRLYRALYGGRAAVEETILHHPGRLPPLLRGRPEPSATPSATVQGVTVHSGDILVSRGGAPTSALIARGSDYPGNFSHVGLVYVDSASREPFVVEAHIERGVAVSTAAEYLGDTKLRVMVLRLRADLPPLTADPALPHRAAARAVRRARAGHIPYDFAMDYADPSRLFCSEVASSVYREEGVTLWTGLSTITAPGLRRWLAAFGVRHFETQEPSDLEYDPQLVVVAEWRDPQWLLRDHVDNAVLDAMLEGAEAGDALTYPWYALPFARLAKGYSLLLEQFGAVGPVPEGMSVTAALRHRTFSTRQRRLAERVAGEVTSQQRERGYPPPYWELLALSRAAASGP